MNTMTTERDQSTDALVERAVGYLDEYLRNNRTRTDLLKSFAVIAVELRARHTLEDGRTDWGGRSAGYRAVMKDIYDRVRLGDEEHSASVTSAIRYHISNALRNRARPEALEDAGMSAESQRARLTEQRKFNAAIAAAVLPDRQPTGDAARLSTYAEALLEHIDVRPATLGATDAVRLEAATISLRNVRQHAEALLVAIAAWQQTQNPT